MTRDLAGPRAGVIAAVLAALYPGFWVFDGEVMSEALVMLLAALVILSANRCFRRCTLSGWRPRAARGLSALTRAELVLLVPLVALPTVLWQRGMEWRRRASLCALALAVAIAPMLPWFGRNLADLPPSGDPLRPAADHHGRGQQPLHLLGAPDRVLVLHLPALRPLPEG